MKRYKSLYLVAILLLSLFAVRSPALWQSRAFEFIAGVKSTPSPTSSPTTAPTQTPTLAPVGQITKKVMVLTFDPLINGTTLLHTYKNWYDPVTLTNQHRQDVKEASHQYVNYSIAETKVVNDYPEKVGGFKFTQAQYLGCLRDSSPSYCQSGVDYLKLLDKYNVCEKLNNGLIDELWVFNAPWFGFWEAIMAGPGAFNTNASGSVVSGTSCNRKLNIMGYNYERDSTLMMHTFAHRTEGTMVQVFGPWERNFNTRWNIFTTLAKDTPGKSNCGNTHFPPNGFSDYDYANQKYVASRCEDWLNYPSTSGLEQDMNCSPWGCDNYSIYNFYEKWWLKHLPHAPGSTNGKLNNWWAYVVDYDNAVARENKESDKWFAIKTGTNDSYSSCGVSASNTNEVYFGINPNCATGNLHKPKFVFPNVSVKKGAVIKDAYLELVTDGVYTNTLSERILLTDGATTTSTVDWNITETWQPQVMIKSPGIKSIVQELVNSSSWSNGNTITVNIRHVSGSGERRVFAFEREPMAGARLVIKIDEAATPAPTATPLPTPITVYNKKISAASDDYNVSACGAYIYPNEVYFGNDPGCSGQQYTAYFVFKNVGLVRNFPVTTSFVEFTADGPYSNLLTESITVTDGTVTASVINWPINTSWILGDKIRTPSLNAAIQQVLNSQSWSPGKSITIIVKHITGNKARRVLAYERDPAMAARLVIR